MKTSLNKAFIGLASVLVTFGMLLGAVNVQAATNYKDKQPTVKAISDFGASNAKLSVRFKTLKDEDVIADVKIKNTKTGEIMHQKFSVSLNGDGRKSLVVNNLKAATKYEFSVRVRKETLNYYSDYSNKRTVTTK
jgi:ribosomal protein S8